MANGRSLRGPGAWRVLQESASASGPVCVGMTKKSPSLNIGGGVEERANLSEGGGPNVAAISGLAIFQARLVKRKVTASLTGSLRHDAPKPQVPTEWEQSSRRAR